MVYVNRLNMVVTLRFKWCVEDHKRIICLRELREGIKKESLLGADFWGWLESGNTD